ncbi:MAG: D-lyxose/D-mannose family sugar isomerase [Phycisphaeraceae bacterium]|nr:D-lyxose/D-mannose family sugar isomerase [Phycisphaeraceae bacterium]
MDQRQQEASAMFARAGLFFKQQEQADIEIADFGFSQFERLGLGVYVYVNTDRCCAKELAMWPGQTCPEHRHPPVRDDPGKEETFRVRWGRMWLYVPGPAAAAPHCQPPTDHPGAFTVRHEIELNPGDQYTIQPNTLHWFQAGPQGCVVSEFSTRSTDEHDIFTDPALQRATRVSSDG